MSRARSRAPASKAAKRPRSGPELLRSSAQASGARAGRQPAQTAWRRLLLLRHAKAERGPELADHERPLAPRGRRDAERMGGAIAARRPAPEQVLCSSSRRTRETLEGILPGLPEGISIAIDRGLYLASPDRILARIAEVDDAVRTLLVVGHNPGIAELAEWLAAGGRAGSLERLREKFPTGALAEIRSDAPRWRDLASGGGMLTAFLTPRELAGRNG